MANSGSNGSQPAIIKNGVALEFLDVSLYVTRDDYHNLEQKLDKHVNSPEAHDEHINTLIDQKLKLQDEQRTDMIRSDRSYRMSQWALVASILVPTLIKVIWH